MGDKSGLDNNAQVLPPTDPFSVINVLRAVAQMGTGGPTGGAMAASDLAARVAQVRNRTALQRRAGPAPRATSELAARVAQAQNRSLGPNQNQGVAQPSQTSQSGSGGSFTDWLADKMYGRTPPPPSPPAPGPPPMKGVNTSAPGQMPPLQAQPLQASIKPTRPIQPLTMSDFRPAIGNVIDVHEGGFQNRSDDPGNFTPAGEQKGTKYGISARAYPNEDIKNLTKQRAAELFQRDYGMFSALADQRVMNKVLDLAVNMQKGGKGPATEILQRAINASGGYVPVDGKFGVGTADAANAIDPNLLLKFITDHAQAHYKEIEAAKPTMKKWFKVWDDRAQWEPPENSSRVPRSNASTNWDADRAISDRERAEAIRSIRNSLAGLSDQPAKTTSAPQRKAALRSKNTPQARAAAVRQAQDQQKKKQFGN